MSSLWGVWFISILGVIHCYDNICERTNCTATQSSVIHGLSADKVIDGNISQAEFSCSHTALNKSVAWMTVDLKKEYQVKNIVIYYRNEAHWKPYRFRQYGLDVSNSSCILQWIQCYKDNTPNNRVPPSVQNISCEKTARYLRIITTYDAPEDDKYSFRGAMLEICEIQVYGVDTCSPNCVDMQCDENGTCIRGCNEGYWGAKCENNCPSACPVKACNSTNGLCNSCSDGHYGDICEKQCYWPCSGQKCNKNNGVCTTGCKPGYYGNYCHYPCGNCTTGTCDRDSGNCETCNTGYFGEKCRVKCSNTCLNQECTQINGHCKNGCRSGFYGSSCNIQCSQNCAQTNCRRNGICINGCKPNWTGGKCDTINQASESNANTEVFSALYGVITVMLISIFLNIFFIVRNVRQTIHKRQNSKNVESNQNSTTFNDRVEENAGYEELGELSQPSLYDELRRL